MRQMIPRAAVGPVLVPFKMAPGVLSAHMWPHPPARRIDHFAAGVSLGNVQRLQCDCFRARYVVVDCSNARKLRGVNLHASESRELDRFGTARSRWQAGSGARRGA